MTLKYRFDNGEFLSPAEAERVGDFLKCHYKNEELIKEERFYKNELKGLNFYVQDNMDHQSIIQKHGSPKYKWYRLLAFEWFGKYKLEKVFAYEDAAQLSGINLSLYDPNGECIAYGSQDAKGQYDYAGIRKYYWDRSINPGYELFECSYYEDSGLLLELEWFNFHIDPQGQESFVLLDEPADREKLKELTGMSDDLIDYYMSPEIVPSFGN